MKLLALDQAARVTGYAIFEDKTLIDYGSFEIKSNQSLGKRLTDFLKEIDSLYKKYNFDAIAYEDIQLQMGNVDTYKKLAYFQAMILFWGDKYDKKLMCLSPSHWRKILKEKYNLQWGRKRVEQKTCAINFIKDEFNIDVNSDTSDAICIGLAANIERHSNEAAF